MLFWLSGTPFLPDSFQAARFCLIMDSDILDECAHRSLIPENWRRRLDSGGAEDDNYEDFFGYPDV
jgi:hypothetical protein